MLSIACVARAVFAKSGPINLVLLEILTARSAVSTQVYTETSVPLEKRGAGAIAGFPRRMKIWTGQSVPGVLGLGRGMRGEFGGNGWC